MWMALLPNANRLWWCLPDLGAPLCRTQLSRYTWQPFLWEVLLPFKVLLEREVCTLNHQRNPPVYSFSRAMSSFPLLLAHLTYQKHSHLFLPHHDPQLDLFKESRLNKKVRKGTRMFSGNLCNKNLLQGQHPREPGCLYGTRGRWTKNSGINKNSN